MENKIKVLKDKLSNATSDGMRVGFMAAIKEAETEYSSDSYPISDLLLKLELIPNRQTHRIVIGTDTSYLIQREIIAIDLIVTALIT